MGDMADFYGPGGLCAYEPDFNVWIPQNGDKISIKEMTSQHLVNTINMLKRYLAVVKESDYRYDNMAILIYPSEDAETYIEKMTEELERREKERKDEPQIKTNSYLITATLLNAWQYLLTSEKATLENFLITLRREKTESNESESAGYDFETWAEHNYKPTLNGQYQVRLSKPYTSHSGTNYILYGRLDCIKAGKVYDYKHTSKYEVGKFFNKPQTSMYLELVPEATQMTYVIGTDKSKYQQDETDIYDDPYNIYTEDYSRAEITPISRFIEDFEEWLHTMDLWGVYTENWKSK